MYMHMYIYILFICVIRNTQSASRSVIATINMFDSIMIAIDVEV